MNHKTSLEDRIRYKGRAASILGLSWTVSSGVCLYFLLPFFNTTVLYLAFGLVVFALHISVGFVLKAPTLLVRNIFLYPFAVVVAQILNAIWSKWFYAQDTNPVGFALLNMFALLFSYIAFLALSSFVLRFTTAFEAISGKPIASYSYSVKSTIDSIAESLRDFVDGFRDVSAKIIKQKNITWIRFSILPNIYAVAVTPKEKDELEVNVLFCREQNDVVCKADTGKADLMNSLINAFFTTMEKQGRVSEWKPENAPKYSENQKDVFLKALTTAREIRLKAFSFGQSWHNTIDWVKTNKKVVVAYIVTAILGPLIVNILWNLITHQT